MKDGIRSFSERRLLHQMVDGWSDLLKPLQCPRGFSTCKCRNVLELQGFLDCLRPIEYPPQIRAARTTDAPNAASTCWRTAFGTRFQGGLASTPVRDICSSRLGRSCLSS